MTCTGVVRSFAAAAVLSILSGCAASTPAVEDSASLLAEAWCQVDVRNATEFNMDASYSSKARGPGTLHPIGFLSPDESTVFAVPCAQGRVSITAVASQAVDASLRRGQSRVFALAELKPNETALVVLRAH